MDHDYQYFIIEIMTYLEPHRAFDQEILFLELDDIEQIDFFLKGNIDFGYEIDNKRIFKLRFKNWNVIGASYATFNRKAMFICKTASVCTGFLIRKGSWQRILRQFPDISKSLKFKILREFYRQVK